MSEDTAIGAPDSPNQAPEQASLVAPIPETSGEPVVRRSTLQELKTRTPQELVILAESLDIDGPSNLRT
ncbi:MAG: hypothetical protein RL186_1377, partial [Pseudomonadota bacterium]